MMLNPNRPLLVCCMSLAFGGSHAQYLNARSLHGMGREHVLTDDGGRVVFGETFSSYPLHSSTVSRLDAQDQLMWTKAFLIKGSIEHVEPLDDGSYMVHTRIVDPDTSVDRPAMLHLDNAGDLLDAWYFEHGPGTFDYMHSGRTADGANVLTSLSPTFAPPYNRNVLVKVADNGTLLWSLGIVANPLPLPRVFCFPDGRILWASVVGDLIMLESNGTVAWTADYPYGPFDALMRPNGNYLLAGVNNATNEVALLELDGNGDFVDLDLYGHDGMESDGYGFPDRGPRMALASNGQLLLRSVPDGNPSEAQYMLIDTLDEPIWGMISPVEGYGTVSFLNDSIMLSIGKTDLAISDAILRRALVADGFTGCVSPTVPIHSDSTLLRGTHNYNVTTVVVSVEPFTPILPVQPVFVANACDPLSAPEAGSGGGLDVYPNPVDGVCRIQGLRSDEHLTVFDLSGRALMTPVVDLNGTMDLGALPEGVHILRTNSSLGPRSLRLVRVSR